jgi:DNA-binding IclR family transcriptional regulator
VNKKLNLLRFLSTHGNWYTAAQLAHELEIKPNSVGAYLIDLEQAALIKHRDQPGSGAQYKSKFRPEEESPE